MGGFKLSEGWEGSRRRAVGEGEVGRECDNDGGRGGGRARATSPSRGKGEEEGASSLSRVEGRWVGEGKAQVRRIFVVVKGRGRLVEISGLVFCDVLFVRCSTAGP